MAFLVVDFGPSASKPAQADTAGMHFFRGRGELFVVVSLAVELPDEKGVTWLQHLLAGPSLGR